MPARTILGKKRKTRLYLFMLAAGKTSNKLSDTDIHYMQNGELEQDLKRIRQIMRLSKDTVMRFRSNWGFARGSPVSIEDI